VVPMAAAPAAAVVAIKLRRFIRRKFDVSILIFQWLAQNHP
jgi:hypothetical protein